MQTKFVEFETTMCEKAKGTYDREDNVCRLPPDQIKNIIGVSGYAYWSNIGRKIDPATKEIKFEDQYNFYPHIIALVKPSEKRGVYPVKIPFSNY